MANTTHIKELAKELNLFNIAKGKVDIKGTVSNTDYLENILLQEIDLRHKNRVKREKDICKLPKTKFIKTSLVDGQKWQVKQLEKLEFIKDAQNIIITGKCGTGKSALASEICNIAIEKNYKVVYLLFDKYIDIVKKKVASGKDITEYRKIKNADILVLDEFLYLDIDDRELKDIYKSIMQLNETLSIIFILIERFKTLLMHHLISILWRHLLLASKKILI